MQMTNYEIVQAYTHAKFPQEQVNVLAQLNNCGKEKIVSILNANGIVLKTYKRNQKHFSAESIETMKLMRECKRPYLEIATSFHTSITTVMKLLNVDIKPRNCYTKKKKQQTLELINQGKTIKEISVIINQSYPAISNFLRKEKTPSTSANVRESA